MVDVLVVETVNGCTYVQRGTFTYKKKTDIAPGKNGSYSTLLVEGFM
jgi:hypothetical protein